MKIDTELEEAKLLKDVGPGCSLSPILFNLYIKDAIDEIKETIEGKSIYRVS